MLALEQSAGKWPFSAGGRGGVRPLRPHWLRAYIEHSYLSDNFLYLRTCCRSSRQEPVPQSVSSSAASSSSYSRSAPRSRDLQPASRPTARVPPPAESQTAVRNDVHRRHQAAGSTKPYNNGEPTAACRPTSDWSHSSVGNDQPATANGAYESCIAAITRQQVDSFMARCHRSHPTAAAARRNIRQNPTVVWPSIAWTLVWKYNHLHYHHHLVISTV